MFDDLIFRSIFMFRLSLILSLCLALPVQAADLEILGMTNDAFDIQDPTRRSPARTASPARSTPVTATGLPPL